MIMVLNDGESVNHFIDIIIVFKRGEMSIFSFMLFLRN